MRNATKLILSIALMLRLLVPLFGQVGEAEYQEGIVPCDGFGIVGIKDFKKTPLPGYLALEWKAVKKELLKSPQDYLKEKLFLQNDARMLITFISQCDTVTGMSISISVRDTETGWSVTYSITNREITGIDGNISILSKKNEQKWWYKLHYRIGDTLVTREDEDDRVPDKVYEAMINLIKKEMKVSPIIERTFYKLK